jgi:hypothetical protein
MINYSQLTILPKVLFRVTRHVRTLIHSLIEDRYGRCDSTYRRVTRHIGIQIQLDMEDRYGHTYSACLGFFHLL